MAECDYDVVIVGAGISGTIVAKQLGTAGLKVLILEAGPTTPPTERQGYLNTFFNNTVKTPESPYPPGLGANPANEATPRATVAQTFSSNVAPGWQDRLSGDGFIYDPAASYMLQKGPQPFLSTYERVAGGTTWHWLGTSLRFLDHDFSMQSTYGVEVDWPISAADLETYYGLAEHEIGVSADATRQEADLGGIGLSYPPGYSYPMQEIPMSLVDTALLDGLQGTDDYIGFDGQPITVTPTPQGRNSQPFGSRRTCAGNTNCIPICPIQAKYDATITLSAAQATGNVTLLAQAVAIRVHAPARGAGVTGIDYVQWSGQPGALTKSEVKTVTARAYILAAHAIETPKLLLMSPLDDGSGTVANGSDQVGRNLMDHPLYLSWALMPQQVWGFRGPLSSSGIESLRDGPFRAERAAWRVEIGNEGWNFSAGDPWTTVQDLVNGTNNSQLNPQGATLWGTQLVTALNDAFSRQWRMGFLVEQEPVPESRVTVNPANGLTDGLGLPRPVINYVLSEYTRRGFVSAEIFSRQVYQRMGVKKNFTRNAKMVPGQGGAMVENPTWFANPEPEAFAALPDALKAPDLCADGQAVPEGFVYYGAGHLVGTYRMGADGRSSVVNADSRSWDHPNLWLVGDGVFPTITTANPTLTLAALAFRAADAIRASLA